ncbi:DegT/DnrJ/EryC1/StrS aminotransferase family protein [Algoriphagus sp. Y33]|uniref:DegT/DnrJ/EryC1/StrS family aminotransferase n=1 Tax=Algoriphagus sp. Y33 TaxID=2772483 RepID=UPI00177F28D3|nr:DegT/DnrJ/EryC1/StrS family aminotransferase [Algoriphagus sp. Y33]
MAFKTPLSFPVFEGNENSYTQEVINSGSIATSGRFLDRFELELADKLKVHPLVALNSCTSALHLSMILLGVGPGDEVICQSFTFCASANPIMYLGARPVFVDSERDSWNLCPELLEDAILNKISKGRKPKAIVVVHLFGMPAKMNEIMEISKKYEIPVLEDAAEAVGSLYRGQSCGALGQIGVFSFNANKIITGGGGGGALVCQDSDALHRSKYLSTQARENIHYYKHKDIGYNYRMNNLTAGIALAQLEQLDGFVAKRRAVNQRYRSLLKDIPGIEFQSDSEETSSNFWLTAILIDKERTGFSNDELRIELFNHGIETRFLWKPLHTQPVFNSYMYYGGGVAAGFFERGLCLPSSVSLTMEDQEMIAEIIQEKLIKTAT